MTGKPARQGPPRPPQATDFGTGPVVLLIEVALFSIVSPIHLLLAQAGPLGQALAVYYIPIAVLVVVGTALGMWLRRRRPAHPVRRGRSKVIPFPEHRRRRGA